MNFARIFRWFRWGLVFCVSVCAAAFGGQSGGGQQVSPVFRPIEDDPALPRVLLIGDSISIGYTLPTRALLKGKANVHRIPTNAGPTTNGVKNIDAWLGDGKWDVIHFNWGLHDLKFMDDGKRQVGFEDYEKNLTALVNRMKKTGAKLIWCSTTPVLHVPPGRLSPKRLADDVPRYNAVAAKIMQANDVLTDDLWAFALPRLPVIQREANVHFFEKGSALLAGQVAASIEAALAGKPLPRTDCPPLARSVDLDVGESAELELCDGSKATVKLLDLKETRDTVCDAVRKAEVKVEVNGKPITLVSATYRLPQTIGDVQIDCPITTGYTEGGSKGNVWALEKDARLRLWPAGSPWVAPGTFTYPAKQRWFATDTQMANDPVYVDGGDKPGPRNVYYHSGLDIGGADAMVEVVAATDALVVSAGDKVLDGEQDSPASPRYDVLYLRDDRGWYYRYSHFDSIDPAVKPGVRVLQGQKIGVLGKEGGSGGWSHLHFEIKAKQPSGGWGTEEGYAFLWQAYCAQYAPPVIAVARPHHLAWTGEKVVLDGSLSRCDSGKVVSYEWTCTDGMKKSGPTFERTYSKPGMYSEILKVTDSRGNIDYDFAAVQILDKSKPEPLPPSIHPTFYPSLGIKPGDPVTFLVRTFRTTDGEETWDFGDGSDPVTVQSDGNVNMHAKDGYARIVHRFDKPGDYLVRVQRSNRYGQTAVGRLHVPVRK